MYYSGYAFKTDEQNKSYNEAKEIAADPNAPECTDPDKIMEFMLA